MRLQGHVRTNGSMRMRLPGRHSRSPEPTDHDHQYAEEWRARCRDNAAERRTRCAKPTPRAGQTIIFDTPLSFSNGQRLDRFDVAPIPQPPDSPLPPHGSSGLYRISNVKHKHYQLL